jgi:hypothetical protein
MDVDIVNPKELFVIGELEDDMQVLCADATEDMLNRTDYERAVIDFSKLRTLYPESFSHFVHGCDSLCEYITSLFTSQIAIAGIYREYLEMGGSNMIGTDII